LGVWLLAVAVLSALALTLGLRIVLGILLLLGLHRAQNAEIVLSMLEIVFGHYPVALGIGVPGELKILLVNMRCGTADFDLGTV
jgi:hypothetical protein